MTAPSEVMISQPEVYRFRLAPLIEQEIARHPLYLDQHTQTEWLEYLLAEMMEHLTLKQFMARSDEQLKTRIGRLMALKLVFGLLKDFTPTQINTFEECLVRR
jgi:hypothetical protein